MRPLVLLPLLLLTGCELFDSDDVVDDGTVVFEDVEVEAVGDASITVRDGALVVSGLEGNRSGGFAVEGTPARVDVETDPIDVPGGGRFGTRVERGGEVLASIDNVGRGGGQSDIRFAFADRLGVSDVTVRYRLDGDVVFEIESLPLFGSGERRQSAGSAGTASGDAGSVHVIRGADGRYRVVSDSKELQQAQRRICSGYFVIPPEPFTSDFPLGICADWIEVEPVEAEPADPGRVFVTAQGVGSFTVRQLDVRASAGSGAE